MREDETMNDDVDDLERLADEAAETAADAGEALMLISVEGMRELTVALSRSPLQPRPGLGRAPTDTLASTGISQLHARQEKARALWQAFVDVVGEQAAMRLLDQWCTAMGEAMNTLGEWHTAKAAWGAARGTRLN